MRYNLGARIDGSSSFAPVLEQNYDIATRMICIRSRVSSTKTVAKAREARRPTLDCEAHAMSLSTNASKHACSYEWTLDQAPRVQEPNPAAPFPPHPQHPQMPTLILTSSTRQCPYPGLSCVSSCLCGLVCVRSCTAKKRCSWFAGKGLLLTLLWSTGASCTLIILSRNSILSFMSSITKSCLFICACRRVIATI